jgi:hypothetical protein
MSVGGGETQWLWPTPIGLHRYPNAERVNPLLVKTFAEGRAVQERQRGVKTDQDANQEAWAGQTFDIRVGIEGMWFQCSRAGAFHDIHTHGNCSWSGVDIVQIDNCAEPVSNPVYGDANGVTRLYGPMFERLGGAFVDVDNAYLQTPHQGVGPLPGQLLLF